METSETITVGNGSKARDIAFLRSSPKNSAEGLTGVFWLGGFRSDMAGTKAEAMVAWASARGLASLRFDYSGHGASGGNFTDGTISRWLEEALAVFGTCTNGDQILVGSSMGGWIALRMAQELRKRDSTNRLSGLLLIAPAPDFTSDLMEPSFTAAQHEELRTCGYIEKESAYSDEPDIITRSLLEDGRKNRVLNGIIETGCPVHILQGMADSDVPHTHAMRLIEHLPADNVTITLVKEGDHRLSRDSDLKLLERTLDSLVVL